ncbi:unnamed protein product [Nippostrongylus brasiliensis]|uniref:PI3K/PI4K domain-containing protein n=1 Tax=Nippostrongylus brasiliensis TaxID=27835 RepID=A0A0N4Y5S5_NIPBR|nr:unnamed protein product [Nippostrongylus brasiliensis]
MERKSGVPATTAALDIDRPTDLFQKKMRGLFAENNVEASVIADRSKWPHNLLREVFNQLVKETPKDLISRSTAVMSLIGAILGLGDRHLDNVLGRYLRVPETVPFRLTQNVLHALGPTQVEGVFRESCSQVLSTLREGREVLLTVLDAFVYDPLERVEAGRRLKSSIARHHHIMKDFRPLLKALATCDEDFASYIRSYRERFSEPLVKAHQLLDADSLDMSACLRHFAVVQNNIGDIYLGLLSLNDSEQAARVQSPSRAAANQAKADTPELPPGFEGGFVVDLMISWITLG